MHEFAALARLQWWCQAGIACLTKEEHKDVCQLVWDVDAADNGDDKPNHWGKMLTLAQASARKKRGARAVDAPEVKKRRAAAAAADENAYRHHVIITTTTITTSAVAGAAATAGCYC